MNEATLTLTPDGNHVVIGTGVQVPDNDPSVDFEDGGSHPIHAPDMTGPEDGIPAADVAAMAPDKAPEPEIPGPNPFEVRGYEVAKLRLNEWEQVSHYANTQMGLIQAIKDARWLSDRHPRSGYAVRVLVSAPLPMPQAPTPETDPNPPTPPEGPLRLDADEDLAGIDRTADENAGSWRTQEQETIEETLASTPPSTESGE